jgi:hypothetical protein
MTSPEPPEFVNVLSRDTQRDTLSREAVSPPRVSRVSRLSISTSASRWSRSVQA